MLNAIIIDDENKARESLNNLLKLHCPDVDVCGMANSAATGYDLIQQEKPDIVFLDVEMPGGSGFDLLNKFDQLDFRVIFTTAYGHYAIKAIKFSALDYLLKPIDVEELMEAVQKATDRKGQKKEVTGKDHIATLLQNLNLDQAPTRIIIPDLQGMAVVEVGKIVRCESDRNYTEIHMTEGQKLIASRTLKEFEQLFEANNFFRIHHSHLINLDHVTRYVKGEGGYVILSDGSEVEISRRRKAEFLERLGRL